MVRFTVMGALLGAFIFTTWLWIYGVTPQPAMAAAGGTITGKVVFSGSAPAAKKIKVTKDPEKCGSEVADEELVVASDRGIKNVVVSVAGVQGNPPKLDKNATVDQKGCVFNPRVVIVPAGAPLDILNSDGVLHNFHTYSSKNPVINKAQPGFKKKMTETFAQAEVIKVTCDAHPWMLGWVVVTNHPYVAATDASGTFKIAGVPPGNHTIEIWHETLGKTAQTVSVKAGEEAKLTIEIGKK